MFSSSITTLPKLKFLDLWEERGEIKMMQNICLFLKKGVYDSYYKLKYSGSLQKVMKLYLTSRIFQHKSENLASTISTLNLIEFLSKNPVSVGWISYEKKRTFFLNLTPNLFSIISRSLQSYLYLNKGDLNDK